jgi:DNA-binding XRE family transcriptional regulator
MSDILRKRGRHSSRMSLIVCRSISDRRVDRQGWIRQRLARNLRRLRTEQGWSQEDYADRAGIHRTYVSDIERGARNPTITVVEKLAGPFGVPAASLLE